MRLGVVINRKSGVTLGRSSREVAERTRAGLSTLGTIVEERIAAGRELPKILEAIAGNPDIDTIVAGGGDGTVSLAAQHALRTGKRLLPIPFGTFNLFSRTLGWGGDPEVALGMIARGEPASVDVGFVNDLIFVHHVSCGLHPRYVRLRDALSFSSRTGKLIAAARALIRTVRTTPIRRMTIEIDDGVFERRALGLAVTVNRLAEFAVEPPIPEDPEGGQLAVYVAHGETLLARAALIANAVRGRWEHNPNIETWATRSGIVSLDRKRFPVSVDGELYRLQLPLRFSVQPHALDVVRPRPD